MWPDTRSGLTGLGISGIQAAKQAKVAGAKQLVLYHISARYPDASLLLQQAKKVFPNSIIAEDYLEIEVPLSE